MEKLHPHLDTGEGVRSYINPGTGPVENSKEEYANKNIEQLVKDVDLENISTKRLPHKDYNEEDNDGRFAYQLGYNQRNVEVQMPGWPLEKVRFLGKENQDILDFLRLYVDDSSWIWKYAVNIIRETFENPDEE